MLDITINAETNIATLKPSGPLTDGDLEHLTTQVDRYIELHEQAPNLLIVAREFHYWDSFNAFGKHVGFVQDHHRLVQKIAFVSDSPVLSVMPVLGDFFVSAKLKHFSGEQLDEAYDWLLTSEAAN